MLWAAENGIVAGYGHGLFGTDDMISRQDLCVMLLRYAQWAGVTLPQVREPRQFSDAHTVADYAQAAVLACCRAGIIEGRDDGSFDPAGEATRAEVAVMLQRLMTALD